MRKAENQKAKRWSKVTRKSWNSYFQGWKFGSRELTEQEISKVESKFSIFEFRAEGKKAEVGVQKKVKVKSGIFPS